MLGEPVAYAADCLLWPITVNRYVLAADVRQGRVVAIWLSLEDEGTLFAVSAFAEKPYAEVKA